MPVPASGHEWRPHEATRRYGAPGQVDEQGFPQEHALELARGGSIFLYRQFHNKFYPQIPTTVEPFIQANIMFAGTPPTGGEAVNTVIKSERRGKVRWIVMDKPEKRNALDRSDMIALTEALSEAGADPETRVVVLRGAGKAFCTGADLAAAKGTLPEKGSAPPPSSAEPREAEFNVTIRTLWNLEKPVIAAVDGIAAGFGCSLALACDVRLASSAARLSLIFVKRGLALDGGASFFLTRLAGLSGLEMALTGDVIDAAEALRLRLVNRVIDATEFDAQVTEYAERMAGNAPLALAAIKKGVHDAMGERLDDTLREELVVVRRLARTEDVREGVAAFLEKRPPVFRGK